MALKFIITVSHFCYNKANRLLEEFMENKSLLNQKFISKQGIIKSTRYVLKNNTEAMTFSNQKFLKDLEDMLRNKAKR